MAPRQLIAVEDVIPGAYRQLRAPSELDLAALVHAEVKWERERHGLDYPSGLIRVDRHDDRPRSYGIDRYEEMFTPRQLLVLSWAFYWIRNASLPPDIADALEIAISNALTTNNRLCGYATDYGRLSALFTIRGYSLPALSVELNPLHRSAGRGTIAACIQRMARSGQREVHRYVWSSAKNKVVPHRFLFTRNGAHIELSQRDASTPPSSELSFADVVVFDPPYFDYIVYDELSEFHRVWLNGKSLPGSPLMPTGFNRAKSFGARLGQCLQAVRSSMHYGRPLAFTYRGTEPDAWRAIGIALDHAQLRVTALWPVRSDGHMGHHRYPGNSEWDIVVVCRPVADTDSLPMPETVEHWVTSLSPIPVSEADRTNFRLAIDMTVDRFGRLKQEVRK